MESEEESKSEDSDSEPEGGEAETTVSQTSSESAKESAANPPLHQSTIETVPTQPPASQTSTRATTATQLLAKSTIPASESTKESSANQPLLQPMIETVPTQPADEMATNQLMDDDSLAMTETFVNTVLGDLQSMRMGLGNNSNGRAGYNRAETGPDYLTAACDNEPARKDAGRPKKDRIAP